MIDSNFRSLFQVILIDPVADLCVVLKLRPNHLTIGAMIFGVVCLGALLFSHQWIALLALLFSGLLDATDGTLARRLNMSSDKGCILDIAGDRLVEASVVLGLYLYDPSSRGWPALVLLASFYLCITTFLLSGIFEKNLSNKSFHYSPGLIERGETFFFFALVIIWEESFYWAALVFATLVTITAIVRFFELLRLSSLCSSPTASQTSHDVRYQATTPTTGP